jgi:hypothetical protein
MSGFRGRGSLVINAMRITGEFSLSRSDRSPTGWSGTFMPDTVNGDLRGLVGEIVLADLGEGRRSRARVRRIGEWGSAILHSLDEPPF